jgi:hypothetical protein
LFKPRQVEEANERGVGGCNDFGDIAKAHDRRPELFDCHSGGECDKAGAALKLARSIQRVEEVRDCLCLVESRHLDVDVVELEVVARQWSAILLVCDRESKATMTDSVVAFISGAHLFVFRDRTNAAVINIPELYSLWIILIHYFCCLGIQRLRGASRLRDSELINLFRRSIE